MKKIVGILFILFFVCTNLVFAQDKLTFIYINGSNNNDLKMKKWFFKGIAKFHPILKTTFENDEFAQKKILKHGKYSIASEPKVFFWGDLSKPELEKLKEDLTIMDVVSPKLAQLVRRLFALCIHDAIWVSKFENMHPIVEMLHAQVLDEHKKGNQTILLGYSAGSFITYEYYFLKLPAMSKEDILELVDMNARSREFFKTLSVDNTCMDALIRSDLITYDTDRRLCATDDYEYFKIISSRMNTFTKKHCAPKNSIKGVINYASPIVLFFSDPSDPNQKFPAVKAKVYKHVVENDLFYLTLNFADDPMGYPLTGNINVTDVQRLADIKINPSHGFFYDKSDIKTYHTFLTAHTSYWKTSKLFAKSVVGAYKEGYNYFYSSSLNESL